MAGIIGVVAASFVALAAGKLGYDWTKGAAELGLATLAFVIGMFLPTLAAVDGEVGFAVAGAVFTSLGAYLLFRAATKTAAG